MPSTTLKSGKEHDTQASGFHGFIIKYLRSYNVDEDQHPCQLVHEHFGPHADGRIIDVVNHWLTNHAGEPATTLDKTAFPAEGVPATIPLLSLYLPLPVEKPPPLVTWSKFAPSIWNEWEPNREPLEVKPLSHCPLQPGEGLKPCSVGICRGYTRATILCFALCQTLMVEDPTSFSQEEQDQFSRPGHSKQVRNRMASEGSDFDLVSAKPSRFVWGKS